MEAYTYKTSGLPIWCFGQGTTTFMENDLAERFLAVLGELAYKTGHTTRPDLRLTGSFGICTGIDPHTGQLVIGLRPEGVIDEAVL